MPHPTITAHAVRRAVTRVRRAGPWKVLARLEHTEPALAEVVLEELTELHQVLMHSPIPPKRVRELDRRVQSLLAITAICLLNAPRSSRPDRPPPPRPMEPSFN